MVGERYIKYTVNICYKNRYICYKKEYTYKANKNKARQDKASKARQPSQDKTSQDKTRRQGKARHANANQRKAKSIQQAKLSQDTRHNIYYIVSWLSLACVLA